ncbi:MAG: hypothetical protein E6Q59_05830 [Nitrosomonas sp.]|nr:MAG: hypothetical protein E6Q59_05830 [Nitrosomonas sp.]
MTTRIKPLQIILERLACTDAAKSAFFSWDEVKGWPPGVLDELVAISLLQPMQPVNVIECDGCEENCIMPVTIYPVQEDKPGKAFITCDKRDDIGRVPVDFRRMQQWQSDTNAVCKFIADSLGLHRSTKREASNNLCEIGIAAGNKRRQMLCLQVNGVLHLVAGNNKIPLSELVEYDDNGYKLDETAIRNLVDIATTADNRYTPSNAKREAHKLDTVAMYRSWQKEFRALKKKHPNMSDAWYSGKIAKMEIANRRSAETIRKNMKLQK